jgi:hypothetical protein
MSYVREKMVGKVEIIDSSENDRVHFQFYFVSDDLIIQPPTDMYLNLERFSTERNNFPFSIP